MKRTIDLALCVLMFSVCGLLGNKGVPKDQVNADIGDRTITAKDADNTEQEWRFKEDSYRCFAPSDTPGKTTESDQLMPINISAIRLGEGEETPVLFGEIVLHYKKDNGKWRLESIESKDVRTKVLTGDNFSKFMDLQKPLCNYFKYRS